jgi:MAF protein
MSSPAQSNPLRLASASPRRRELLHLTGWQFAIEPAAVDESVRPGETPPQLAERLSQAKARAATSLSSHSVWTLAADTVVGIDGEILGKPGDPAEAAAMLSRLSGREHDVYTAIAVSDEHGRLVGRDLCHTRVPMHRLDNRTIKRYVDSGSPMDKAGAYGIQDASPQVVDVDRLCGCYANVMGLPLCHVTRSLRALGMLPSRDVAQACMQHTGYDCPIYGAILDGLM